MNLCIKLLTKRGNCMKINITIDESVEETQVNIIANSFNKDIELISSFFENPDSNMTRIIAIKNGSKYILQSENIVKFYSFDKKVFALYDKEEYQIRLKLYELENRLDKKKFIRISNSEIVNIDYVKKLDFSFKGTIKLEMKVGQSSYVSRSYLKNFKESLGV